MKCRNTERFLTEYFYDQPQEERLEFLKNHFRSCPDCQQAQSRFEATLKLMEKREKLQMEPGFWHDFQTKLEQRLAKETIISTSERELLGFVRNFREVLLSPALVKAVSMVTICLIVIWAGFYLFYGFSGNKSGQTFTPPKIASNNLSPDDDWALLSELLEQEEDWEIMQEIMDEEEIDLLLEVETYLEL